MSNARVSSNRPAGVVREATHWRSPRKRVMLTLVLVLLAAQCAEMAVARTSTRSRIRGSQIWHTLLNPIDPQQLTGMPFGTDSPWLQPWRSTLTTRPATSLLNAIGINLDVSPAEAPATTRLLHESGFRRARLELPWNAMSYSDPTHLANPAAWTPYISLMRQYHIRPLILLNANSGGPGPSTTSQLNLTEPARQGATTVSLTAGSAAQVVPGLTGFDTALPYPQRPGDLITHVGADGVAELSRPLPMALPAGPVSVTTLRYAPFAPPYLADGSRNPRFERTLSGWLTYVRSVADFVRDTYGSSNFDIEVWNELTFGSAFLDEANYYSPLPDPGSKGDVTAVLLERTVQTLHDPANGLAGVKVGDGFSNQMPWPSGATVPLGTNAIDKHPYSASRVFPESPDEPGIRPLNALGGPNYLATAAVSTTGQIRPAFVPRYRVFMPEYLLTGTQTETLMRDLSPITTNVYDTPHGARTHPIGGAPPRMWITEDGLDATEAVANGLPTADIPEFQAKTALRLLVSYASEGAHAIDLFAANGGPCCQLIPQAFFNAVDANPASYPATRGGLTMLSVKRMTSALAGAKTVRNPRRLTLPAIAQRGNAAQFSGDGGAALPSLYNRDVLAFFPFQLTPHRFVSAVYVMTRDLTHYYTSDPGTGATPYDLPPEQFRLTIGGVDGRRVRVSLTDPLTAARLRAHIVARKRTSVVVQMPVTDSPRMLTIDDGKHPAPRSV